MTFFCVLVFFSLSLSAAAAHGLQTAAERGANCLIVAQEEDASSLFKFQIYLEVFFFGPAVAVSGFFFSTPFFSLFHDGWQCKKCSWATLHSSALGLCRVFERSWQPHRKDQGGLHADHLQADLHGRQMSQQLQAGQHHHHHQRERPRHRHLDGSQLQSR